MNTEGEDSFKCPVSVALSKFIACLRCFVWQMINTPCRYLFNDFSLIAITWIFFNREIIRIPNSEFKRYNLSFNPYRINNCRDIASLSYPCSHWMTVFFPGCHKTYSESVFGLGIGKLFPTLCRYPALAACCIHSDLLFWPLTCVAARW